METCGGLLTRPEPPGNSPQAPVDGVPSGSAQDTILPHSSSGLPAASALVPTLGDDTLSETRTRIEMSTHARRRTTKDEKTKRPEESGRGRHECPRHIGGWSVRYAGYAPPVHSGLHFASRLPIACNSRRRFASVLG